MIFDARRFREEDWSLCLTAIALCSEKLKTSFLRAIALSGRESPAIDVPWRALGLKAAQLFYEASAPLSLRARVCLVVVAPAAAFATPV